MKYGKQDGKILCKDATVSNFFENQLNSSLAFWLKYSKDEKNGGYIQCLSRNGTPYDYDKICTWSQGRIAWSFGHIYNNYEKRKEWLDMATHGVDFMLSRGIDSNGRVYYGLTAEGAPLFASRDIFADLSLISALIEIHKATGNKNYLNTARNMILRIAELVKDPASNKTRACANIWATRPTSLQAEYMILLNTVQQIRECDSGADYDEISDMCINRMLTRHYDPKNKCSYEAVKFEGGRLPGVMGRWVNPGHMMELGWFLIHEADYKKRQDIVPVALNLIKWGMECGWDNENGGVFNDIDIEGKCMSHHCYFGKLWWSACEALYANLLAYKISKEKLFWDNYQKVLKHTNKYFIDNKHPEWFAVISHRGEPIDDCAKGTERKNCFHIIRAMFFCFELIGRQI